MPMRSWSPRQDGDILGFAASWDGDPVYIDNLHVAAEARSQRHRPAAARRDRAPFPGARTAKRALLHVVAANRRARAFYLALGGRPDGIEEKDLYGAPVPNERIVWNDLRLLLAAAGG